MQIGMLWFDNSPTDTLETKIKRSMAYYRRKYNIDPNLCFVHPTMVSEEPHVDGITIKTNRSIRPNHFWMGVE